MTAESLAQSLVRQAEIRAEALSFFMEKSAWHVVVREAQECVELGLKGILRCHGIEPPKIHDVSALLLTHRARLEASALEVERLAAISQRLRKERELSFYGDIDFIPEDRYSESEAAQAHRDAVFVVEQARSSLASGK